MGDARPVVLLLSLVVIISGVGVGYGVDHFAYTNNTNNSLNMTYNLLELEDYAGSSSCVFKFDNMVYYMDRTVSGNDQENPSNNVTTVYRSATAESHVVNLYLRSANETPVETTMTVQLAGVPFDSDTGALTDGTYTLQFYTDQTCQAASAYGDPIEFSDTTTVYTVTEYFDTDTFYFCKMTIAVSTETLDIQPAGNLEFDVVFSATAFVY